MPETPGARRVVSALIADVAGSTAIGEQLGPERSKLLFDDVVQLMREQVERFGGTVAQLTGDGVLALFGAPTAHEDDSERAVRAALALHESVARYAAELSPVYGIELAVRVAVNTGPVVVPSRDAPPDVLYNALGDTVNVAARLQSYGDLILGPTTARQLHDLFELEELGDLELKGKSEAVRAFRVVSVRERPPARLEAQLVGREQEVAALSVALDGLIGGKGGAIVSITGEPGIGKSRLVAEVDERFDGQVRFLTGHAVSYAETIPYWPVREMLRGWLGLGVSDPEVSVRLELRAELARSLAEDAEEAYPFLASLLGLALTLEEEQRIRDFAPDAVQDQTSDWLYWLVCALARERPLCLVLEDLHWSDEATLSLLDELLPAAEQAPVAFLLVHRSDPDHPAWHLIDGARRRFWRLFLELELQPLPGVDARALAEAEAGGELPEGLVRLVAERAGGNPYFVSEAVRDLRERGSPEREDGRTVVGEASIPTALQQTLQARLDRLDTDAHELITTAAVIGRSFGLPLLERLLPRMRLLPTLSKLQWLQLLVEERSGAAPEYRFRHGLVQEVAYGSLVEDRRRELHLRVGEALIELHRDSPAEVYGLLARHFTEADEATRAVEYLLKAGDAARAVYAKDEAIELYRRALGFMERTRQEERARKTLLKIALTHHLTFDYHAANEAFSEAFARAAPEPSRLEPTERITWAAAAAGFTAVAPGHSYSLQGTETTPDLFRGLVAIGADLDIEPDLAERFTVSDDGRSYRFTLRRDALWSDGAPVTAGDFEFTFAQMVEDDVPTAYLLDGVNASAVDERMLDIRLREPRNHFLHLLGQPPFFAWPRHIYEREGRDWHRAVPLVGSGPFVLRSSDENGVVMEAAPSWYGARGNVGEVRIELETSPAEAADRWRNGAYDVLDDLLAFRIVVGDETVVQRSPGTGTWYLGFHAGRAPCDDPRVRLALAHAVDRREPANLLRRTATATGGLLPPAMPGHSHRVAPAFDPDRARTLLGEAGYSSDGALGEIVLACLDLWEDAASDVAAQLAEIGIRVRLLSLASDPDLEAAIEEQAHAYIWAWLGDYPDPVGGFMGSALITHPWLYRDEELEELLARAVSLHDQDEQLRISREFERIWIGEQAAVVPIAYDDSLLWRRPWVTRMWINAIKRSSFAEAVVLQPHPAPQRG
jgi:ABC-type transport system substrate-binding protein/class 3 adenylate cyclase